MYVNLEINGRYDWGGKPHICWGCIQVSDANKLTDIFLEDAIKNMVWNDMKPLFEKDGGTFSAPIQISNDRQTVKFDILCNSQKIGWWLLYVINWENIWRA